MNGGELQFAILHVAERMGLGADVPPGKKFKSSINVQQLASSVRDRFPFDTRYLFTAVLSVGSLVIGGILFRYKNEPSYPTSAAVSNENSRMALIQEPNEEAENYFIKAVQSMKISQKPYLVEAADRLEYFKRRGLVIEFNNNNRMEVYAVINNGRISYIFGIDPYFIEHQNGVIQGALLYNESEYLKRLSLFVSDYQRQSAGRMDQASFDKELDRTDIRALTRAQAWKETFEVVYEGGLRDGTIPERNILKPLYDVYRYCKGQRYFMECFAPNFRQSPRTTYEGKKA